MFFETQCVSPILLFFQNSAVWARNK